MTLLTKKSTTLALEDAQDKSLAHKFQREDYKKIIADRKNTKKNLRNILRLQEIALHFPPKEPIHTKDTLDALLLDLHEELLIKLKNYYLNYSHDMYSNMPFSWVLGMCKQALVFLEEFNVLNIAKYIEATWSYEEKYEHLQVLKHLIALKIYRSYRYFLMLSRYTLNTGIDIIVYLDNISETSFNICGEARCLQKHKKQIDKVIKKFEKYLQSFDESRYSPALIAWAKEEIYLLSNYEFSYEEEQIITYLELLRNNKQKKDFMTIPLIIESEEGVLYV